MKYEIKHKNNGNVLFSRETESLKLCVEAAVKLKVNLSYADLRYADLSYANLNYADLSYADLRYADLNSANLRRADLRRADLRSANLNYSNLRSADLSSANICSADLCSADICRAKTDKRYIQVSCIGSRKSMTTYCFDDDKVLCGCFNGTLDEFQAQVNKTHKDNPQYLKEYMAFITMVNTEKTKEYQIKNTLPLH